MSLKEFKINVQFTLKIDELELYDEEEEDVARQKRLLAHLLSDKALLRKYAGMMFSDIAQANASDLMDSKLSEIGISRGDEYDLMRKLTSTMKSDDAEFYEAMLDAQVFTDNTEQFFEVFSLEIEKLDLAESE